MSEPLNKRSAILGGGVSALLAVALVAIGRGGDADPEPQAKPVSIVEEIPIGAPCDANADGFFCGRARLKPGKTDADRDLITGVPKCDGDDRVPTAELCDGIDNDCDQNTDEGFYLGQPCWEGFGLCRQTGVVVCPTKPLALAMCSATGDPKAALAEVCSDGIDQDCTGDDLSCLDVDADGDGLTPRDGDCDDTNAKLQANCPKPSPSPPATAIQEIK